MPEQSPQTSKTRYLEIFASSIKSLMSNGESITLKDGQEIVKNNNELHVFSTSFANRLYFSKRRENISVHAGSAPLPCSGTGHLTDLPTAPWTCT